MNQEQLLIKEADDLIGLGEALVTYGKGSHGDMTDEKIKEFTFWTTRTGQFINRLYGNQGQYALTFNSFRGKLKMDNLHSNSYFLLIEVIGALEGVKHELQNGLLKDLRKLLQADIFSDFLEMAEYFLNEGYKDAAAVIIGGVLEDSLKKLADANSIPTTNANGKSLTIEPINVELAKKGVYNQLIKKQITSWADLRNDAAHGDYGKYDKDQVKMMFTFVQKFVTDYLT
jgi:hypothetical protein